MWNLLSTLFIHVYCHFSKFANFKQNKRQATNPFTLLKRYDPIKEGVFVDVTQSGDCRKSTVLVAKDAGKEWWRVQSVRAYQNQAVSRFKKAD